MSVNKATIALSGPILNSIHVQLVVMELPELVRAMLVSAYLAHQATTALRLQLAQQ
jgi:hypothetical protein